LPLYIYYVAVSKNANLATVFFNAKPNSLTLFGLRVKNEDIRDIERHSLILDATGLTNVRVRLDVLLGDVDAFHQYAPIIEHLQNSAATALVLTGSYDDFIAFSNLVHMSRG
jgi:hypothetical protein